MNNRKRTQSISPSMIKLIKETHKYTTAPWTSKFNISYIGYGHKITSKDKFTKLTKKKAETLLEEDLQKLSASISKYIGREIHQHHFDVFCHIAYDYSLHSLKNSSLFIAYLKGELKEDAVRYIMIWSKIQGIISLSMLFRRNHDIQVFMNNQYKVERK